jgi:beta-lactam-binding protein with PASTA domain
MTRETRLAALLTGVIGLALACTGCSKAIVPELAGQDVEQAKQMLAAAKLKPGNITGGSAAGSYVLNQNPRSGEKVAPNTPVDLQVEEPSTVPDMTNNKITDAVNTLQQLGLKVAFVKEPTSKLFGGSKVVRQSPAANTVVHRGTMVTLNVSTPPDLGVLVGLVTKDPVYNKLNPEYRQYLDAFLK